MNELELENCLSVLIFVLVGWGHSNRGHTRRLPHELSLIGHYYYSISSVVSFPLFFVWEFHTRLPAPRGIVVIRKICKISIQFLICDLECYSYFAKTTIKSSVILHNIRTKLKSMNKPKSEKQNINII